MLMSPSGCTTAVCPHSISAVEPQASANPCPRLFPPPLALDTPQTVPSSWPERLPIPAGASNVSQKAGWDRAQPVSLASCPGRIPITPGTVHPIAESATTVAHATLNEVFQRSTYQARDAPVL